MASRTRLAKSLPRALGAVGAGVVITLLGAVGSAYLVQHSTGVIGTSLRASANLDDESGERGIVWNESALADQIGIFRARNAWYSGLRLAVRPEELAAWNHVERIRDWVRPVPEPWNTERESILVVGWPFRCLVGSAVTRSELATNTQQDFAIRAVHSPLDGTVLPLGVLPGGMLANTLCWSAAVAVVGALVGWTRRARRRRAGQCERCGYRLSPSSGLCPECGTAPAA